MRSILPVLAILSLFAPSVCLAKRVQAKPVAPVVVGDMRIEAPLDSGRVGRIQAFDRLDGHLLWSLVVFENKIDPQMEEDVQWRFIESMKVVANGLEITVEMGARYHVDLKTHKVVKLATP